MLIMAGTFTFPGINFVLSTKNSMPFHPFGAYVFCYSISGGFTPLLYPDGLSGLKIEKFYTVPGGQKGYSQRQ
jgi:hypothetical protein